MHHEVGQPTNRIYNLVIVPDKKFGDLKNDENKRLEFRRLIAPLIDKGIFFNSAIARNLEWFGVWVTFEPAEVTSTGSTCPEVKLSSKSFEVENGVVLVPNAIVVVHREPGVGDCAWRQNPPIITLRQKQPATNMLEKNAARIIVHELGHTFGLPDEYSGAPSYCATPPVLYTTKAKCEDDDTNLPWRGGSDCQELFLEDGGASFWLSERHLNIMSAKGDTVLEFGQGAWQIIRKFYTGIATGMLISQTCTDEVSMEALTESLATIEGPVGIDEPEVFPPDDWP
jgi:hypothetical protein